MAGSFITTKDFEFSADEQRENDRVLRWGEVFQGKIYKVVELEIVHNSKFGKKCLLYLASINRDKILTF